MAVRRATFFPTKNLTGVMGNGSMQFRIESLPGLARHGALHLTGWALGGGRQQEPPDLRISGPGWVRRPTARTARPDVIAALGAADEALMCGFEFRVTIPSGVHRVALEAETQPGTWTPLSELIVVATAAELAYAIEHPATAFINEPTRPQGWCVHPEHRLAKVFLHYGNRRMPCEYGIPRSDVVGLVPTSPDASHAGFIAERNLSATRGTLRIKAESTSGRVFFGPTSVAVEIATDEENRKPLNLAHPTIRLKRESRPPPFPGPVDRDRLRVLFVLYGDFTSNSALHVLALVRVLSGLGHECVVAVPQNRETAAKHPNFPCRSILFSEFDPAALPFANGGLPHVVHAWTTRENVRLFSTAVCKATGAALFIHLEDHEGQILETHLGTGTEVLLALPPAELEKRIPPTLSHPRRSREFLAEATGVTVIVDRLRELVPPGIPTERIWPAADATAFFPREIPWDFRHVLGWNRDHTVLFYHGNVHATNATEVASLYEAVALLNLTGTPTTLIRTGRDEVPVPIEKPLEAGREIVFLGQIDRHAHLPALMSLADYFVQPGVSDTFNQFRFPSKLPEFFALGRPVILPQTNLGENLVHGEDAWVLPAANADSIAEAVRRIRRDPDLAAKLARNAISFAERNFSWPRSAGQLLGFYRTLLHRA